MAEEVEMTPVEAAEPPKANPLSEAAEKKVATIKLNPLARKPGIGTPTASLKPGLKLPTQVALKPGIKLPAKPIIRKPGATVVAAPLPKPVAVDTQGVGKVPTVEEKAVDRGDDVAPVISANQKPMDALKSVTQKLKGITQEIPQQAILRKTGIIADETMSDAQKEAAKHKTARISLSDAMGVAPVKDERAPMKTIRIKRPIDIPGAAKPAASQPDQQPVSEVKPVADVADSAPTAVAVAAPASSTITQRKTLKISRPGGAVRPAGKFGVRRPGGAATSATTVVKQPAAPTASVAEVEAAPIPETEIGDIPDLTVAPVAEPPTVVADGPVWLWALSTVVQAAACVAIGALAWLLFQNTQVAYF